MQIKIQLPKGFLDAEIRCGYRVTAEMKKVWAVELDLLYEFQRVKRQKNSDTHIFFKQNIQIQVLFDSMPNYAIVKLLPF